MGSQDNAQKEQNRFSVNIEPLVEQVLAYAESTHCRRGEAVMLQGNDAHCLYYVKKGAVEVSYTLEGADIVVAIIGEKHFFGEIGFFDGISRVRDVRAKENSEICTFKPAAMERLQADDAGLYAEFLNVLARLICEKFRRVLEEREPLTGYAASLSVSHNRFDEARQLPKSFFTTDAWRAVNQLAEDFKAQLFDLSYRLQKHAPDEIPPDLEKEGYAIIDAFNASLQQVKTVIDNEEAEKYVWGYVFKEFFPYFMRSRLAERVYYKPKGYAGDFMMMEMIYRNRPEGDGKLGLIMDGWFLNSPAADAVRGRRKLLADRITQISREKIDHQDKIRIMNLACGSNRELFDFLSRFERTESVEALCIDIDADALAFTNRHVNVFNHQAIVRLMNENLIKWAIGRVQHDFGMQDIIYSSGLTDYLDRRLFVKMINRCHAHLNESGILIVGNFGPQNPNREFMDHILHWNLIYRDEAELRGIFHESSFGDGVDVISESHGINLFVVARKT